MNNTLAILYLLLVLFFGAIFGKDAISQEALKPTIRYSPHNNDKEPYTVQQTDDGGYIMAGKIASDRFVDTVCEFHIDGEIMEFLIRHPDVWIVKTNKSGMVEWEKSYGGKFSDLAKSIVQTVDGGYIVAGTTYSEDWGLSKNNGNGDGLVMKLNRNGGLEWQKLYGGKEYDGFDVILPVGKRGYMVVGTTTSTEGDVKRKLDSKNNSAWVVQIDTEGKIVSQQLFEVTNGFESSKMASSSDGGFVLGINKYCDSANGQKHKDSVFLANGEVISRILHSIKAIKLSKDGTLVWRQEILEDGYSLDISSVARSEKKNGYLLGCTIRPYYGSNTGNIYGSLNNALILKLAGNGQQLWKCALDSTDKNYTYSIDVQPIKDNGCVAIWHLLERRLIADSMLDSMKVFDVDGNFLRYHLQKIRRNVYDTISNIDCVVKIDKNGKVEWRKKFPRYGKKDDELNSNIITTNDDGFLILSNRYNKNEDNNNSYQATPLLKKLDSKGNEEWIAQMK